MGFLSKRDGWSKEGKFRKANHKLRQQQSSSEELHLREQQVAQVLIESK